MGDFGDFLKELEATVKTDVPVPQSTTPSAANDFNNYLDNLRNLIQTSNASSAPVPATTKPSGVEAAPALVPITLTSPTVVSEPPKTTSTSTGKKLKFMLISTHCQQVTGYSKVSYGLLKELVKQPFLEVIHYGFQKMPNKDFSDSRPYPNGVQVIDAAALEAANTENKGPKQGFGYAELPAKIQEIKPDVVMLFNDMSVINQFMEHIKRSGIKRNFATWLYVDQVYNCQLNGYLEVINREADRVFAFTKEWKECLKEQGVHRPVDVIAHGFDSSVFYSIPKTMARKRLGLPDDIFLFMSLNRNQPRKRYDLLIMAFVELIVKYPTKPLTLMCVCDKGEKGGWWLFEIFVRELKLRNVPIDRFANRLMVTQRDMDFKDEEINALYNAADVGISAADGEGWGLCSFEHMGVGVPQIVPALGGYREFCTTDNSVMVKPKHRYYMPMAFSPVGGEATAVDPHDLCLGMETYVNDSTLREKHAAAGKAKVATYTWAEAAKGLIRRLKTKWEDDE
jgi:glycosyltransferase involved in cell wall biosynthesis